MKMKMLAAVLGVSGLLFAGCSPAGQSVGVVSPRVAAPSAVIRSQSDLQRYVAATAGTTTPLGALSSGGRERFLASVTFNEKGITGFRYDDLRNELTASQIHDVLHLFGAEREVAVIPHVRVETAADKRTVSAAAELGDGGGDYSGYACTSRATCTTQMNAICMSSC